MSWWQNDISYVEHLNTLVGCILLKGVYSVKELKQEVPLNRLCHQKRSICSPLQNVDVNKNLFILMWLTFKNTRIPFVCVCGMSYYSFFIVVVELFEAKWKVNLRQLLVIKSIFFSYRALSIINSFIVQAQSVLYKAPYKQTRIDSIKMIKAY